MKTDSLLGSRAKIRITLQVCRSIYSETNFKQILKKRKEKELIKVISKSGKPLMPCANVIGRLLLKLGKAHVKYRTPFTIKLNYETTTNYVQELLLTCDTGSKYAGFSAGSVEKKEVYYMSQVEVRNDIPEKMTRRSKYRRNRRNRKTPYRKARWNNRKNSKRKDRFSPTMTSKTNSHIKEINFICSILPISKMKIETGTFDPHALKNPEVLNNKDLYQYGLNYGFANSRAYVLDRDGYKCQNKNCITKNETLHAHHIIYRRNGGSDEPENLLTLCKPCHDGVHDGTIELKIKGKKKGQLKHATQMNSIRQQLLKLYPDAKETFGYITKEHRQLMKLPKEHCFDAVAMIGGGCSVTFKTDEVLFKKCVADGDYQLSKGVRSEQKINVGKIGGFRKFDKVKYMGKEYFIKGRMTTGYTILMDIDGNKINLKPIPKLNKLKRLSVRSESLTTSKKLEEML